MKKKENKLWSSEAIFMKYFVALHEALLILSRNSLQPEGGRAIFALKLPQAVEARKLHACPKGCRLLRERISGAECRSTQY